MSEIREAVQIVIDRMRAHPEEFTKHSKLYWVTLMLDTPEGPWRNGLNDAELAALNKEYAEINYRIFHSNVMKSLLEEETPSPMERQGSSLKPPTKFMLSHAQVAMLKKKGLTIEEYVRGANIIYPDTAVKSE